MDILLGNDIPCVLIEHTIGLEGLNRKIKKNESRTWEDFKEVLNMAKPETCPEDDFHVWKIDLLLQKALSAGFWDRAASSSDIYNVEEVTGEQELQEIYQPLKNELAEIGLIVSSELSFLSLEDRKFTVSGYIDAFAQEICSLVGLGLS